jgi:hypothetical protein
MTASAEEATVKMIADEATTATMAAEAAAAKTAVRRLRRRRQLLTSWLWQDPTAPAVVVLMWYDWMPGGLRTRHRTQKRWVRGLPA